MIKEYWEIQTNKERLVNILTFVTLLIAFAGILVVTLWLAYPYKPLIINKQPFEVINHKVRQNGILIYKIDFCKSTDKSSHVIRNFVDGILFTMPAVEGTNTRGCKINTIFLQIPSELPVGIYTLEITYIYQMNPFREIKVIAKSEPFEVVN